jgi:hypothetical protein
MPIIAKNIIVAGDIPATIPQNKPEIKTVSLGGKFIAKNIIVTGSESPATIPQNKPEIKTVSLGNRIIAKNIIVAGVTIPQNEPEIKTVSFGDKNSIQQTTKQLPKYIAKEDGELLTKINTKSQYMRDIFDLDS